MTRSYSPQTRFELAVHQGWQLIERGFARTKLLLSVSDAAHHAVAWYAFAEGYVGPMTKVFDDIVMSGRGRAERTIAFGDGPIDHVPVVLRRPRAVDRFHITGHHTPVTTMRIHDARFLDFKGIDGRISETIKRLELDVSLDLVAGNDLEIVRARLSMLSLERPQGNIHPARGMLILAGTDSIARASKLGPSPAAVAAASSAS